MRYFGKSYKKIWIRKQEFPIVKCCRYIRNWSIKQVKWFGICTTYTYQCTAVDNFMMVSIGLWNSQLIDETIFFPEWESSKWLYFYHFFSLLLFLASFQQNFFHLPSVIFFLFPWFSFSITPLSLLFGSLFFFIIFYSSSFTWFQISFSRWLSTP